MYFDQGHLIPSPKTPPPQPVFPPKLFQPYLYWKGFEKNEVKQNLYTIMWIIALGIFSQDLLLKNQTQEPRGQCPNCLVIYIS